MTYRVSQTICYKHVTSRGSQYRTLFRAGISYASSNKHQYVNEEWFTVDKMLRRDRWSDRGGQYYKLLLFYDTVSTEDIIKHRIIYGKLNAGLLFCRCVVGKVDTDVSAWRSPTCLGPNSPGMLKVDLNSEGIQLHGSKQPQWSCRYINLKVLLGELPKNKINPSTFQFTFRTSLSSLSTRWFVTVTSSEMSNNSEASERIVPPNDLIKHSDHSC